MSESHQLQYHPVDGRNPAPVGRWFIPLTVLHSYQYLPTGAGFLSFTVACTIPPWKFNRARRCGFPVRAPNVVPNPKHPLFPGCYIPECQILQTDPTASALNLGEAIKHLEKNMATEIKTPRPRKGHHHKSSIHHLIHEIWETCCPLAIPIPSLTAWTELSQ